MTLIAFLLALHARSPDELATLIDSSVHALQPKLLSTRRQLHEHPELSNQEEQTSALVAARLEALGVEEVQRGIARHGVTGVIRGQLPGGMIALRADLDALPVTEQSGLPFASKVKATYRGQEVGVMHACGHDVHTTVLLGTAEVLMSLRDHLAGAVLLVFQPAEEGAPPGEEGGAKLMLKEGLFDRYHVKAAFALHCFPDLDVGNIAYTSGGSFAGADRFRIAIHGKQTHAAYPWDGVDPVVTAAQAILALQTIHSRQVDTRDPFVLSVGMVNGGTRWNIIPEQVLLEGTVRTLSPAVQSDVEQRIRRTLDGVTAAAGASYEMLEYEAAAPVTVNEPVLTEQMARALQARLGADHVHAMPASMGSEDFGYFAERVPGFYFRLGVRRPGEQHAAALHTPGFFADEQCLTVGVTAMATVAMAGLAWVH
ncbi:MAG: amidohydrolase [Planctomycetota bacterium]